MLTKLIKNISKIHTRDLTLTTYPHIDGKIIVHGVLKDQRYIPVFDITGEIKNPGIIHHMDVKLLIATNPLRIELAEAQMLQVPIKKCHTTLDTVKGLEKIQIKSGFSGKIRELMGGKKGCTHLCHLITVMGQEIVHGWLTEKRKDNAPLPKDIKTLNESNFLIDSCRMWTKDGPKMKNLIQAIKDNTN
ncbi:MAG: DUF2889 domain-containing protein [Desulfobacula sp.]|nr:DUF2889 domain-containing protein [Desulfobacula sp.]